MFIVLISLDTLEINQKYMQSFEIWRWQRMEISWTDCVKNEVWHRAKGERNILHAIKRRKANWICQIRRRNCLLKHVMEGSNRGKERSDGNTR